MVEQANVVDQLKEEMMVRMRQQSGIAADDWVAKYTALAADEWKRNGGAVAVDYPKLFGGTEQKIRAIVHELLGTLAKEPNIDTHRSNSERPAKAEGHVPQVAEGLGGSAPTEPPTLTTPGSVRSANPSRLSVPDSGASVGEKPKDDGIGTAKSLDESSGTISWASRSSGTSSGRLSVNAIRGPGISDGYGSGPGNQHGRSGGGIGPGSGSDGDAPDGTALRFYRIGFWALLFMLIVMSGCLYWNIKFLRYYYLARKNGGDEWFESLPGA
jgi:hypothetical protein